ncbi:endonuclease/exonuclease/phosphatase family protein [Streptomyces sp. NPDC001914]|uniref:endonuclease/exonuclease/phosphatase family protein n=1 Tax=Streptomyces sp. NPDC001914 TaxID=3364623 RepID=UPI0036CDCA75
MRRIIGRLATLCTALFAVIAMSAVQAHAEARPVPVTAGDKYALRSVGADGLYVSAEVTNSGDREGMLRARKFADSPAELGSWEKFTLHTHDKGWTATLRSEANGNYVATERNDSGSHQNLLRARSSNVGEWEELHLERQADGTYALKAWTNDGYKYVTAEMYDPGDDKGLLRARGDSVGSWQKFELVFLGEENASDEGGRPDPASPAPAADFRVMSWNVCANNNTECLNNGVGGTDLGSQISDRLGSREDAKQYRALFLQELCESHAKAIEQALESKTGTGWDVRFAPIKYTIDGSSSKAAKTCNRTKVGSEDRGAYGIALAVPDSNVWYTSYDLPSPQNQTIVNKEGKEVWTRMEQRTALCAVLPAQALQFCGVHFSSGAAEDDPHGVKRLEQAALLQNIVHSYTPDGYRTVYGGDFNSVPSDSASTDTPHTVMDSAYAADKECDEGQSSTRPRDGQVTKPLDNRKIKIDYLFGPPSADISPCNVVADAGNSDHYPIKARFQF